MLNKDQIKLVQTAVRAAGIRNPGQDGRYRLLLAHYKQPNRCPVASCKDLNNWQLDDLLAICEAQGWRQPDKSEDFYRRKVAAGNGYASFAVQSAINHLRGDLGWPIEHLHNFIEKMTGRITTVVNLTPREGYKVIEGLKAIFNHKHGTNCSTIRQIKEETQSRNSDKPAESGTFALNGLQEVTDDSSQI